LVLAQQIFRNPRLARGGEVILEEVFRVEFVVAEELEGVAVKLVGSDLSAIVSWAPE